ncbi:MAG: glycosyl hydrolase family 95 catalytic domain-containing protein [Acutalibacter sp.]|jgi:alpha-L-fucosidase 2
MMKHPAEIPVSPKPLYGPMTLEKRRALLPRRVVCSLAPAQRVDDALTTGNGRQRISVMGDPYEEELSFTHELLFEPKWAKTPEPPDFTGILPQLRQLLREGKFEEAGELADKTRLEDPNFAPWREQQQASIYPVGSLRSHDAFRLQVSQPRGAETREYVRWLDMLTGCVTVQWEDDRGTYRREAVTAYDGDVHVLRLTTDAPQGVEAEIQLVGPLEFSKGKVFSSMVRGGLEAPEKCREQLTAAGDTLTLELAYCPEYGQKGYCSVVKLSQDGGRVETLEKGFLVQGAQSVTVIAKTRKYEENFTFGLAGELEAEVSAFQQSFDQVLEGNRAYLGERMERSQLQMGEEGDFALSAEELLRRTHTQHVLDPTMLSKLYDMGRFYQITDTGEIPPFWGQHNINTNLQVCAGNNTGLFDEMDVYFRYYESKFEDFRTNARKLYGARGLLASVHCDYDSGLYYHFSKTYPHYAWTGCLGWIYNELWGYYLVTGDLDFLRNRVVPGLKEIALFFEDYAKDRDENGRSIFYPSFSPEDPTPIWAGAEHTYPTRINSVMDIMICREVLDNLMEACRTLGIEEENLPHWQAQRDALPLYLLDEEGGLKEWAWPTIPENFNHRHVSHHYDLWPGHYITWEDQPELARAIQISNRKRGHQDDSAHGIIHRTLSAARLKDVEELEQSLGTLMAHGFVTRALSTRHFPYYAPFPDLQGAMPAILLEMCVFSQPGEVEFLPAMPSSLSHGALQGVWLYTWVKLNTLVWEESGFTAELVSQRDQELTLRFRGSCRRFQVNGETVSLKDGALQRSVKAGETLKIRCDY